MKLTLKRLGKKKRNNDIWGSEGLNQNPHHQVCRYRVGLPNKITQENTDRRACIHAQTESVSRKFLPLITG